MIEQAIGILFVDDQWCRPELRCNILAEYGELERQECSYAFHYETAETTAGRYGVAPVMQHVSQIPNLTAVVLDVMFGENGSRLGLEILATLRTGYPTLPIFMMTSLEGNLDVIERAMELGANEYLIKKPTLREMERVLRIYTQPSAMEFDFAIWGNAAPVRHMRALIARVSAGGIAAVLVIGESGTGKELVARAIHRQGPRRAGPFIDKNCAGVSTDLLDSDLFGHEKGAFTGATQRHIGRIERADKGILFLDEISSMSHELQSKLLRVLETKQFQRVGGTATLQSDFQLICATNQDPAELVKQGTLREDFYYRIKQFDIVCPPLRGRQEDVPILAGLFLRRFRASAGASYQAESFAVDAIEKLTAYPWPGNVRELKNVVERAAILTRKSEVDTSCLPPEMTKNVASATAVPGDGTGVALPEDPASWPRQRLLTELRLAVEAKQRSKSTAEFMRRMYPEQTKTSTAALQDLVRRLTKGPWGDPSVAQDVELTGLLKELQR